MFPSLLLPIILELFFFFFFRSRRYMISWGNVPKKKKQRSGHAKKIENVVR